MLTTLLLEPMGRAELSTGPDDTPDGVGTLGIDVTEQIVVVTLTTVVDVSTTVALAGQFEASVAHLVTVKVDVARTTVVVTSLRARGMSATQLEMFGC